MGIAFWFTYSSTVLEMKIWINLSKSNALIYSYIVLQKTEKFTGLGPGVHCEDYSEFLYIMLPERLLKVTYDKIKSDL